MVDFRPIRDAFKSRGVDIDHSASVTDIALLESATSRTLPDSLRDYFLSLDGFKEDSYDRRSMIKLWSIKEILKCKRNEKVSVGSYIPIGDFFIKSELIVARTIGEQIGTIWWEDRQEKLADNIYKLCVSIVRGELDLNDEYLLAKI